MIVEATAERGGSPSVEAAVLTVTVGLVIAFAIAGGRLVVAEAAVDHAARSAARAVSLQRAPATATDVAERAARSGLAIDGLRCDQVRISVDPGGLAAPVGTPASVRVTVGCTVPWSDLGLPGAPGGADVEATWASPVDAWRERP